MTLNLPHLAAFSPEKTPRASSPLPTPAPGSYTTCNANWLSGDLLRRHVTSKKALVITNDKIGPLYLDKTVKVWLVGAEVTAQESGKHCG